MCVKQLAMTASIVFAVILATHSTMSAQVTTYSRQVIQTLQPDGQMRVGVYYVVPAGQPAMHHSYAGEPMQAYSQAPYGHVTYPGYAAPSAAYPYDWRDGRRSVLGLLVGPPRGYYRQARPAPGIYYHYSRHSVYYGR